MAATKSKKKVIKSAPKAIDPSKIKKPNCMVHGTPMEFQIATNKWKCITPNCKMVARPKRDGDDKSVTIGKGGVQLRLIAQDSEVTVMLISDDNIALDITKYVELDELMEVFDAGTLASTAAADGREQFAIHAEKRIPLNMKLFVMGASDLEAQTR